MLRTRRRRERPPRRFDHLGRHRADRPGAHREHHVARAGVVQNGLRHGADVVDEHRLDLARHAQRACQRAAVGGHDGRLAGGIDLAQQHRVGRADDLDEILEAVARAGVAVRLEGQHQPAPRERAARGRDGGGHFDGVVAVVVDDGEGAGGIAPLHRHVAVALEAAAHALEAREAALHGLVGNAELDRHGDHRQRIAHVVLARQVQHDGQVGQRHAVAPLRGEMHLAADRAHVDGAHLGVFAEAVAGDRAGHAGHDLAHRRVVGAQDGHAVERHAVQEVDEGLLELREVVPVGLHVVGVDVRDHRHHGQQVQERGVRLVGLDHDVVAAAELRIRAGAVQAAADHEGRVQARRVEHARHEAGGGGLAVRAGNRDALLQAHQLGQHERARHHGNALLARGQHFGVVRLHGGGGDDRVRAVDVRGGVAHEGADAQAREPSQRGAVGQVGAGDLVAQVQQHFGDAAHARAADADEVDVTDCVLHARPPFIDDAICVASAAKPFRGTPRNRLCRAAGVAPGEGVGEATRSARRLGECVILQAPRKRGRRPRRPRSSAWSWPSGPCRSARCARCSVANRPAIQV